MTRSALLGLLLAMFTAPVAFAVEDGLLLAFHRDSAELAIRDPEPRVRIFVSGRVEIYRPIYLRDSGRFEFHLPAADLDALKQAFDPALRAVTSEDLAEAVHRAEQAERATGVLTHVSDETLTRIHYQPNQGEERVYVTSNLQTAARRYPHLPEVSSLARIEVRLIELADRQDGRRIGDARTLQDLATRQ